MGTLYVVATPIGNLEDITLRALRILGEVDVICAEDTRVTKKLLSRYDIEVPLMRYDEHSHESQVLRICRLLEEGKSIALVSDAGTPGIHDPGHRLVREVRTAGLSVVVVPGASALTAALSISGISGDEFVFMGFVPHKKGRETFFTRLAADDRTVVFHESRHRIMKTLASLRDHLGVVRHMVLARELTKMHEEVIVGTVAEVESVLVSTPEKQQGEFVVIVEAARRSG